MLNAECKIVVFFFEKMISIVAKGDTFILHFAFIILHFYRANSSINRNLQVRKYKNPLGKPRGSKCLLGVVDYS